MIKVEARVINLEKMMSQLILTVEQTSREMREFKDEMRLEMQEFKDEMREFKDEMRLEMREFKDEMQEFKDEMREFKDESVRERREMRKQWGELANKMGTMAEDLVAPSVPRIFAQVIGCDRQNISSSAVRVKRKWQKGNKEFDVVAVCGDYVLINETKSNLRSEDIREFAQETLPLIREIFPEYAGKKIIGAIASLYVDDNLVRYGERLGLIVLGFGEDVMDVLNSDGFQPKIW